MIEGGNVEVPITGTANIRNLYGVAYRDQYTNSPAIRPTSWYVEWPPKEVSPACRLLLHTNKLAEAECPLPTSCGPAAKALVDSSWWGNEMVFCAAAGTHHHDLTPEAITTDPDWVHVHDFDVGTNDDLCNAASLFVVIRFANNSLTVISKQSVSNIPMYNTGTKAYGIPYLDIHRRLSGQTRCLTTPGPSLEHPLATWSPPFLARKRSASGTGIDTNPFGDVNLTTRVIRGDWGTGLRPVLFWKAVEDPVACHDVRYISAYAIPGSSIVTSVLHSILNFLVDLLDDIVEGILPFIYQVYIRLDREFRISECLVVAIMSMWWTSRPQHAVAITIVYPLVTGFRRG